MPQRWMEESQENAATNPFAASFFLLFLPSFPQNSMTEEYVMQPFSPFLHLPSTTLLLPCQVATRLTAGFAEAHVCWQHTMTDLVAESRKLTELACENPFILLSGLRISSKTFALLFILKNSGSSHCLTLCFA